MECKKSVGICLFCPERAIVGEGLCELCKFYRWRKKRREKLCRKEYKKNVF